MTNVDENLAMKQAEERLAAVGFDPLTILTIISVLINLFKLCKDWKPKGDMDLVERIRLTRQLKRAGVASPYDACLRIQEATKKAPDEALKRFACACRQIAAKDDDNS